MSKGGIFSEKPKKYFQNSEIKNNTFAKTGDEAERLNPV
jgi:hypothetical protein